MKNNPIKESYQDQMIVRFGDEFLKEINNLTNKDQDGRKVFVTNNSIWDYIMTKNLKLYWLNKKTWIYKLAEIRWQRYLRRNLNYPRSSFPEFLLSQKSETKYYPDTVSLEIKIWFDIRNKILQ